MATDTIIVCTNDELVAMHERGEINGEGYVLTTEDLFEVLCEYYGVESRWQSNDVY